MKLLLMSSTFTNEKLKETFLQLLSKPIEENKVLIIHQKHYAKDTYPEYTDLIDSMLPRDTKIYEELGILHENINSYDVKTVEKPDLRNIDVLYVQGGNVYYYLQQFRNKGYMEDIRGLIERDGVYVGNSAGSNVMCAVVDESLTSDENFFGLEDITGFGFLDFNIIVHWDTMNGSLRTGQIKYSWEAGKRIIPLTDQQAILVQNDGFKIISPDVL